MKKIFSLSLAVLLLAGLALSASALDAEEILQEYLLETKEVSPDTLHCREAYEQHLRHLDQKLLVLTWYDQEAELRGQIAWHQEEERIIEQDELYELLEAERQLAAEEWSRLQEEAGKISVGLYRQLTEMDDETEVAIILVPLFQLSSQLEDDLRALFAEYELDFPVEFQPGSWCYPVQRDGDLPVSDEGALPRDIEVDYGKPGQGEDCEPGNEGSGRLPYDAGAAGEDPAQPREPAEPAPMPMPEPDPWIEEFYSELEQLLARGFQESLAAITAYLDQIGAEYQVNENLVHVTLSVEEVNKVAKLDQVHQVLAQYAEADITPLTGRMPLNTGAEDRAEGGILATDLDETGKAAGSLWPWLVGAGLAIGSASLAVILIKKRQ